MKVLVVGGTGFIGTALCRALDDRGHEVVALSRSPGDADLPAGVETVAADATDYDAVEGAFEGVDAAVNLVALSPLFNHDRSHEAVHVGATETTVRACEAHDVDRLVHLSALGADSTGRTEYLRAKGRAEELVRDAEVGWTIFRPSVVFGEGGEFVEFTATLTPPVVAPLPGGGKTRFQPIWVGDLVEMLADAVEGGHEGQTHEVGGPEVLSLADVARMVRRSKGSSVTILPVPMALADVGLSLAEPVPFLPFGRDQARSLRLDNVTDENDVTAFGVDPAELRTLAAYLGLESS